MTTIKINKTYKALAMQKETGSNYGLFVSVFKGDEKTPSFGTVMKNGTETEDIKKWATNFLKAIQ